MHIYVKQLSCVIPRLRKRHVAFSVPGCHWGAHWCKTVTMLHVLHLPSTLFYSKR